MPELLQQCDLIFSSPEELDAGSFELLDSGWIWALISVFLA
jgi:hypothetical protein